MATATTTALLLLVLAVVVALAHGHPLDTKTYTGRYTGHKSSRTISDADKRTCHTGVRGKTGRLCNAYKTDISHHEYEDLASSSGDPGCMNITWQWVNNQSYSPLADTWGNCMTHKTDKAYRYIYSNSVPDYYFNPYCPFGLGGGYCIDGEPCPFPDLKCGVSPSAGLTPYGDVWVAQEAYFKIPLVGDPTRSDRPGDMYSTVGEGEKNMGPAVGVAINGINIQGPNDAGAVNVDEAGFQLMCGGHVTPPVSTGSLANPPLYHYHKAPDCLEPFKNASIPVAHGGNANRHGLIMGYANDGFAIHTYQDIGGAAPVLDECGGHFGPTDDDDLENSVTYHYHATTYTPYHLACQGPALGKCEGTQSGTSFCGKGCGADVCVQPGTRKAGLDSYLSGFDNKTWLSAYSTNAYEEIS